MNLKSVKISTVFISQLLKRKKYLKKELLPNKRSKSFKEFQGTLIGINDDNSFLKLTFLPSFDDSLIVKISGKNIHFILDEIHNKISVFIKRNNDKKKLIKHLTAVINLHPSSYLIKTVEKFPMNYNYKVSYNKKELLNK